MSGGTLNPFPDALSTRKHTMTQRKTEEQCQEIGKMLKKNNPKKVTLGQEVSTAANNLCTAKTTTKDTSKQMTIQQRLQPRGPQNRRQYQPLWRKPEPWRKPWLDCNQDLHSSDKLQEKHTSQLYNIFNHHHPGVRMIALGLRNVIHLRKQCSRAVANIKDTDKKRKTLASIDEENKLLQRAHQITIEAIHYHGDGWRVIRHIKTVVQWWN